MDEVKKSIRPSLNLPKATTENEQFQNEVLRPILKLQNNIILELFLYFCAQQKIAIKHITQEKLAILINTVFSKNTILRNQLLGIVIGQFTAEEFSVYRKNISEFNKRIVDMMKIRILKNCNH